MRKLIFAAVAVIAGSVAADAMAQPVSVNRPQISNAAARKMVDTCINELLDMADRHMRELIAKVPDGVYEGVAILEDAGHGFGDFEIKAKVTIRKDTCHIAISSPPQIPYFINSYEGNSHSGVYLGLMMFAALPPPYNEGLYRCVSVDFGPKGTICNAQEPAPHMNCTTTPMETLTDAVRLAFEKAMPSKVAASWGHANGLNIAESEAFGAAQPKPLPAQAIDHASGYLLAFGAMTALARRATEGGSWHVRVSLAQAGQWLRGLGRIDGIKAHDPDLADVADRIEESASGFGKLTAVRHSAVMSETPPRWERPSVPLGTHPPAWP